MHNVMLLMYCYMLIYNFYEHRTSYLGTYNPGCLCLARVGAGWSCWMNHLNSCMNLQLIFINSAHYIYIISNNITDGLW